MKRFFQLIVLTVASVFAILFSGCASVTRGTTETVKFESVPPGAQVTLSNGFSGRTPVEFTLKRKKSLTATFVLEGYDPVTIDISSKLAGKGAAGFAGNALIGGPLGGVIDLASGAMLNLTPNPAIAVFEETELPDNEGAEVNDSEEVVDEEVQLDAEGALISDLKEEDSVLPESDLSNTNDDTSDSNSIEEQS